MDLHRTTTTTPTLDAERTGQLRTFLTVEAAAEVAVPARAIHLGHRRLAGGIAAAVVLGAGLFAVASVAGGPSSGPASVQTAHAVAIEESAPGWTKVSIRDVDADPDAVVAELQAAGIEARRAPLPVERDEQGRVALGPVEDQAPGGHGFTMVGVSDLGEPGDGGLAGLSISAPDAPASPFEGMEGAASPELEAAFTAYLDHLGAKTAADGSIEIRNDADLTVLVLTEG